MKRIAILLLLCLLLTACGGPAPAETTAPETAAATEPTAPWIETCGTPWDEEGALTELKLTIPDALKYMSFTEFDGDLLLWGVDNHLENTSTLEMCLIELDDGTVAAQKDISFTDWVAPQVLGDNLYLCDRYSGTILLLNKDLEAVSSWSVEPREGSFSMGAGEKLYIYDWDGHVDVVDLNTGETKPLLGEDVYIQFFNVNGDTASVEYVNAENGALMLAVLDMMTGEVIEPPVPNRFTSIEWKDGLWLCNDYDDGNTCYVGSDESDFQYADIGEGLIQILDGSTLFLTHEDGCRISLHDAGGRALSEAVLSANPFAFSTTNLIPSELYGGYFLLIYDYNSSHRLLYWDTARGSAGEDIPFVPVPEPGEMEAAVRSRVELLSNTYGLNILVGEDCDTYFFDFNAEPVLDWMQISDALDTLEDALEDYPEGFFRQLRYGEMHSVDIHLMGTLIATNSEYTDTYNAFVQEEYDRHTMVVDIYQAQEQTYYHEFSHIIDAFLAWDAANREDALFSEEGWNDLNPAWFPGYTYDYSWEQNVQDYSCFVDSYSTIRPTEDRARVLEYAMVDYGNYTFEGCGTLIAKLDYYCRCIRDGFDTTGWPETVLWEQYLP